MAAGCLPEVLRIVRIRQLEVLRIVQNQPSEVLRIVQKLSNDLLGALAEQAAARGGDGLG